MESIVEAVLNEAKRFRPVDVTTAAQRLGVNVYSAKLAEKVSGVLVCDPSYKSDSGFVIHHFNGNYAQESLEKAMNKECCGGSCNRGYDIPSFLVKNEVFVADKVNLVDIVKENSKMINAYTCLRRK